MLMTPVFGYVFVQRKALTLILLYVAVPKPKASELALPAAGQLHRINFLLLLPINFLSICIHKV